MLRNTTGFASVAALAVALPTVWASAAHAAPSGCTFPSVVNVNISDGSTMSFSANGTAVNAPTTIGPPGGQGTAGALQGSVNDAGHVSLTFIHGANDERNFIGDVGDDGKARGNVQPSGATWETGGPLTCAQAVKAPPDITSDLAVGGIVIHVKNNTADTTRCHYDSEVIDRDFTLNPNATTDLRLVPAVPLLRTWPVTVTCDNGTTARADIDF